MHRALPIPLRLLPAMAILACSQADRAPEPPAVPANQTAARPTAAPDSVTPPVAAPESHPNDLAFATMALASAKAGVPMVLLPGATPSRARTVIDSLVTEDVGAILPDTGPQILATLGMPEVQLTAEGDMRVRSGRLPWLMTQPDETGLRPLAAVGSRVVVAAFHRGIQATAVVIARRRFKGGQHCDDESDGAQYDGFAYLLDSIVVDSAALVTLRGKDDFFAWDLLPHTIALHTSQKMEASLRARIREQALAAVHARFPSRTSGAEAIPTDTSARYEIRELRGPRGTLYAVARLSEDQQNFLAILDGKGHAELVEEGYHPISQVGDLDGDGVDELLITQIMSVSGIVTWHDGRWVMPSSYRGWGCGN